MNNSHESMRPVKTTVNDVIQRIEEFAPLSYALPGDPSGMQIGSGSMRVEKVLVALDANPKSAAAAIYKDCQMLITHHPLIFKPIQTLHFDDPVGQTIRMLCEEGISLYSAHTSLDVAPGGVNTALADILGLTEIKPLGAEIKPNQYKIIVFVPEADADSVIDAMAGAGAGIIGNYQRCAFYNAGQGTFEPMEGANPAIGKIGQREVVNEYRVEMSADEITLNKAVSAMLQVHPYEEPAYDIVQLKSTVKLGIGLIGMLPNPMTIEKFADFASTKLSYPPIRVWGDPLNTVSRVAVVGGSGGEYLEIAKKAGADLLLTGEVKHHHTWTASALNIALIDSGHEATERPGTLALAEYLKKALASRIVSVETFGL